MEPLSVLILSTYVMLTCMLYVIPAAPVTPSQNILNFISEHHSSSPVSYSKSSGIKNNLFWDIGNIPQHRRFSGSRNPEIWSNSLKQMLSDVKQHLPAGVSPTFKAGAITCEMCKTLTAAIQYLINHTFSFDYVKEFAKKICVSLAIEKPRVCDGLVEEFSQEFFTVQGQLSPSEFCSFALDPQCYDPSGPEVLWNVTFPPVPQPPPIYPSPPQPGSPTFRFLHLTDLHYDAEYKEGSSTDCGEPLCCRDDSNTRDNNKAGKFGDYRKCDPPLWTLENMFSILSAQADSFDYIIWTGDLPPHNVWNQSRSDQLTILRTIVGMFLKYFPNKVVFPSLGNHESSPVNSFPPPFITNNNSISWLYNALADQWKQWLPADAQDTIRRGAYYKASVFPGLRVVSLNMNYCNNQNWWMLLNTTDPADELQWLISVLQAAEDDGVKIHILGHIPPGVDDCLKAWSWNYYKIVSRYQNTIAGQFFGHTHYDSFSVFYDVETLKVPVGVAYVAPSVTPYVDLNMGYRIYTVDGNYPNSSFQVLDHETHFLNLSKANEEGTMTWEFEYSAKAAYNMSSVYPMDWENLIEKMSADNQVLELYNKFYTKSRNSGKCDSDCRKLRLCEMKSGRSHDPSLCSSLGVKDWEDLKQLLHKQPKHC